jgi:hypothetical protein
MMSELPDLHLPYLHKSGSFRGRAAYPTEAGGDGCDYTDAESEFIRAVQAFRTLNKISTPTCCHYLWILGQLGYAKGGGSVAGDAAGQRKARPRASAVARMRR